MTFQLLPDIAPFVTAFLVIAAVAVIASLAVATDFLVVNHRVRLARHESIPTYYGRLHFAH